MEYGLVLLGGFVLFSLLKKSANADRLRILPKGVKWTNGKLYVVIRAINATSSVYTINSAVGDVNLKDRKMGTISMLTKTVIPANSETEFPFLVTISLAGFASTLAEIFKTKPAASTVLTGANVAMTINVDNMPVDLKFNL